ncbi:MAG: C40 family peptidase [Bacilli bacterium]|nr:C40 family peptidase [Bacilli bacterium]
MQILSCSEALGTCCGDNGLVLIIDTVRRVMSLIQLVVPILLIVWATFEFMKLVMDPAAKNGMKKLTNKFVAAAIVFFVPIFVNATMALMSDDFNVKACWDVAKNKAEISRQSSAKYINPYEKENENKPVYSDPSKYESGKAKSSSTGGSTWTGGTVTGEDIVAYAMQFKGKGYRLGCHWDGEIPYQNASCIGFIVGLYKHFGIKVPCTEDTDMYLKDPSKFTVVTNGEHRPGDIVIFSGHYAMLTGNGDEIIHSTSTDGIILTSSYQKSGQSVLGIVHVNGVK